MSFLDEIRHRQTLFAPYYEAPVGRHRRMDQNVNLLGPHPAARTAPDLHAAHLYPSRDNTPLLEALANAFSLHGNNFFVGNGSDEILDLFLRVLLEPGQRVVVPHPSYSMYPHLCRLNRLTYVAVPLDANFQTTADTILAAQPHLVLICNPNNPTGTLLDPRVVGTVLERFDGPVLVDEAYAEFAGINMLPLLTRYPNLLIARTLSKAYGLAGLRIGFGVAHPEVAELIGRAKPPFSLNVGSEQIAIRALQDRAPVERAIIAVARERERLAAGLQGLGFRVVPSHANFLLTHPPIPCEELYERLKRRGILARLYRHEPLLSEYIRFTIGGADDTDTLLGTLQTILNSAEEVQEGSL